MFTSFLLSMPLCMVLHDCLTVCVIFCFRSTSISQPADPLTDQSLPPMESTRINNCVKTIQHALTKNWKKRPNAEDSRDWDFDPRPKRRKWKCHLCSNATPGKRTLCDCRVYVHLQCKPGPEVACPNALTPRPGPKRTKWICHLCGEGGPERRAKCACDFYAL